ncbi:hypothetical protein BC2926_52960 [Bacillus cereus]|nr:hypothetical protein BC2926_52960 [Bacillus cereus]
MHSSKYSFPYSKHNNINIPVLKNVKHINKKKYNYSIFTFRKGYEGYTYTTKRLTEDES